MMKKLLLVLTMLAISATAVLAQPDTSYIGMFADEAMTSCDAVLSTIYVPVAVHFYAVMAPGDMTACSAVEFKVNNWPSPSGGLASAHWETTLIIGEPSTDLSLAFNPNLAGPIGYLGYVDFIPTAAGWVGDDHLMTIVAGNGAPQGVIMVDPLGAEVLVRGDVFTFNCTSVCLCTTATEQSNWGSIKSLY